MDPSKDGQFKLPSHNYLVAIPPNSKPQISILSQDENIISSIVPKIKSKAEKE